MKEKKRQIQVCGVYFKYTCTHRADVKTEFGLCSLQLNLPVMVERGKLLKLPLNQMNIVGFFVIT